MEELLIERLKANFTVIKKAIKASGIKGACYDECMKAMVSIINEALLLDMWYYGLDEPYKTSCLILDQRFIWGEMSKKQEKAHILWHHDLAERGIRNVREYLDEYVL